MRRIIRTGGLVGFCALLWGCAGTSVTSRHAYTGPRLARPDHILVYDFAATSGDVAAGSALEGRTAPHTTPQTPDQIAIGRQLGRDVARELVSEIRKMGLSAFRAEGGPYPVSGDLVIKGYLVAADPGSQDERMLVGFGEGAATLQVAVEGYEVTRTGLRLLGSGSTAATGSKTPGLLVGAATLVATGNPVGLLVGGATKAMGESSGSETVQGQAKQTADEIAKALKARFQEQGWI
jgi:hypothetical protein